MKIVEKDNDYFASDRRNYVARVYRVFGIPFIITKFFGDYRNRSNQLEVVATVKLWLNKL